MCRNPKNLVSMKNEERPIDRIKTLAQWFIDHHALSGMKAFELSAGLSPAYIKNLYLTKSGNPGVDTVAKIYKTFKGVSLEWLVLGEGDMLTVSEEEAIQTAVEASKEYMIEGHIRRMLNRNVSKEELKAIIDKIDT